jgi:hypothetical protein
MIYIGILKKKPPPPSINDGMIKPAKILDERPLNMYQHGLLVKK